MVEEAQGGGGLVHPSCSRRPPVGVKLARETRGEGDKVESPRAGKCGPMKCRRVYWKAMSKDDGLSLEKLTTVDSLAAALYSTSPTCLTFKEIDHSIAELMLPAQEFSEVCQTYYRPVTEYGIRLLFPCKSAIGAESSRVFLINSDPIAKRKISTARYRYLHKPSWLCKSEGATVAERLAHSPPTKTNRDQSPAGATGFYQVGIMPDDARWSAGFLRDLPFPLSLNSGCSFGEGHGSSELASSVEFRKSLPLCAFQLRARRVHAGSLEVYILPDKWAGSKLLFPRLGPPGVPTLSPPEAPVGLRLPALLELCRWVKEGRGEANNPTRLPETLVELRDFPLCYTHATTRLPPRLTGFDSPRGQHRLSEGFLGELRSPPPSPRPFIPALLHTHLGFNHIGSQDPDGAVGNPSERCRGRAQGCANSCGVPRGVKTAGLAVSMATGGGGDKQCSPAAVYTYAKCYNPKHKCPTYVNLAIPRNADTPVFRLGHLKPNHEEWETKRTAGEPGLISCRATTDFRKWKSCRSMRLVSGFSRGSPVFPALAFRRGSILTSFPPHHLSMPREKDAETTTPAPCNGIAPEDLRVTAENLMKLVDERKNAPQFSDLRPYFSKVGTPARMRSRWLRNRQRPARAIIRTPKCGAAIKPLLEMKSTIGLFTLEAVSEGWVVLIFIRRPFRLDGKGVRKAQHCRAVVCELISEWSLPLPVPEGKLMCWRERGLQVSANFASRSETCHTH
ncbi:hypothetical protein PR048_030757 [Dryococelus australis]|uniref:Uncharacterized protein n=1 Tax=Dryococelus australis TaxID=614101 RepID=A0ABQ9GCH7_9NEOP|nr:hypothetical protein PR048_030757 [Dryococelus australis]